MFVHIVNTVDDIHQLTTQIQDKVRDIQSHTFSIFIECSYIRLSSTDREKNLLLNCCIFMLNKDLIDLLIKQISTIEFNSMNEFVLYVNMGPENCTFKYICMCIRLFKLIDTTEFTINQFGHSTTGFVSFLIDQSNAFVENIQSMIDSNHSINVVHLIDNNFGNLKSPQDLTTEFPFTHIVTGQQRTSIIPNRSFKTRKGSFLRKFFSQHTFVH